MTMVGAYEAKTHLPKLLQRVSRGETITITRHGVPVAVLAPFSGPVKMTPQEAAADLRKLSKELWDRGVRVTAEEIRQWKHEGHRY